VRSICLTDASHFVFPGENTLSFDLAQNFENISNANDLSFLPNPKQEKILLRLEYFVKQVLNDPVFRRSLRYKPHEALADHGFDSSLAPASLGVKHYTVDTLINFAQIFGLLAPRTLVDPRLELRLVLYGVKPAALLHGDEQMLTDALHWSQQQGLIALLSPDQWHYVDDEGKGGYSNLTGTRSRAQAGSGAERSLVVAQDPDHAMLTWLCLVFGWDDFLGNLLGYPACCTSAFVERWPTAAKEHQGDPTILSLLASGKMPYDWRINIAARYFGVELIQHFPCQFDCRHSIDIATNYYNTLSYFEPQTAETIQHYLQSAILYSEYDGIVLLTEVTQKEHDNSLLIDYIASSSSFTQPEGSLAYAILQNNSFTYNSVDHTMQIDDQQYDKIYFLLFSELI